MEPATDNVAALFMPRLSVETARKHISNRVTSDTKRHSRIVVRESQVVLPQQVGLTRSCGL